MSNSYPLFEIFSLFLLYSFLSLHLYKLSCFLSFFLYLFPSLFIALSLPQSHSFPLQYLSTFTLLPLFISSHFLLTFLSQYLLTSLLSLHLIRHSLSLSHSLLSLSSLSFIFLTVHTLSFTYTSLLFFLYFFLQNCTVFYLRNLGRCPGKGSVQRSSL